MFTYPAVTFTFNTILRTEYSLLCAASEPDSPSILLATTQHGISGLYSLSSLYQLARFLYVIFLWTSKTYEREERFTKESRRLRWQCGTCAVQLVHSSSHLTSLCRLPRQRITIFILNPKMWLHVCEEPSKMCTWEVHLNQNALWYFTICEVS